MASEKLYRNTLNSKLRNVRKFEVDLLAFKKLSKKLSRKKKPQQQNSKQTGNKDNKINFKWVLLFTYMRAL